MRFFKNCFIILEFHVHFGEPSAGEHLIYSHAARLLIGKHTLKEGYARITKSDSVGVTIRIYEPFYKLGVSCLWVFGGSRAEGVYLEEQSE